VSNDPIVAYIDGGARGNPGPAGYGVRVETVNGSLVVELQGSIGVATNNVAEYRGLIAALTYMDEKSYRNVVIRSDSQLLTKQMTGQFRVRHPGLVPLYKQAITIVQRLERVEFEHVRREDNAKADRLANIAMDKASAQKQPVLAIENIQPTPIEPLNKTSHVLSIGIDIESVERLDKLVKNYGDRFLNRVFTNQEQDYSLRRRFPSQHLAGRFAAKEAAMKALGTGRSSGILWKNIEVVRVSGPPKLKFNGSASRLFNDLGCQDSLVTITHSSDLALAQVMLLGSRTSQTHSNQKI
jgi:probable phosphoglycerate mutase